MPDSKITSPLRILLCLVFAPIPQPPRSCFSSLSFQVTSCSPLSSPRNNVRTLVFLNRQVLAQAAIQFGVGAEHSRVENLIQDPETDSGPRVVGVSLQFCAEVTWVVGLDAVSGMNSIKRVDTRQKSEEGVAAEETHIE